MHDFNIVVLGSESYLLDRFSLDPNLLPAPFFAAGGVGKTAIVRRYVEGRYDPSMYDPTIEGTYLAWCQCTVV